MMHRSMGPNAQEVVSASSLLLLLFILVAIGTAGAENPVEACDAEKINDTAAKEGGNSSSTSKATSWDQLLRSGESIVANGNVWPPPSNERRDDCLLLATHTQIIRTCPFASVGDSGEKQGTYEVLYEHEDRRFRGIFSADITQPDESPSKPRRIWLLSSPNAHFIDLLEELDTKLGRIVQTLRVPETIDSHDAVRVGNSVFIVDTRHGDTVEVALPKSAPLTDDPPIQNESLVEDDDFQQYIPAATVIRRHSGFTRADHPNNIAIHRDVLLTSLHGGDSLKKQILKMSGGTASSTRLSVLRRDLSGMEVADEGFEPVDNAGKWCHGIAFWKHKGKDGQEVIKLITLDSKNGSLVSIVLSGPGAEERKREVIWTPDLRHPVLRPPADMPDGYKNSFVFSKGLAVQGGVAYFSVSGARRPKFRSTINPTLLVAVDLETGEELFVRSVQSHGLINQVISESYLAYHNYQPAEELRSEDVCQAPTQRRDEQSSGPKEQKLLTIAEMVEDEFPNLDSLDFSDSKEGEACYDNEGKTRRMPLPVKFDPVVDQLKRERDPSRIAQKLCTLDVSALRDKLTATWNETFDTGLQAETNALLEDRNKNLERFMPGVKEALFVFSDRHGHDVCQFPALDEWLPVLEETVLKPLRIDLSMIMRMRLELMTSGATVNKHSDRGMWVVSSHRTHVPLFAAKHSYLVAESPLGSNLQIPSKVGAVFEFNNAVQHTVRNYEGDRVHLIIDWAEKPADDITKLRPGQVCNYMGNAGIYCDDDDDYDDEDYALNGHEEL